MNVVKRGGNTGKGGTVVQLDSLQVFKGALITDKMGAILYTRNWWKAWVYNRAELTLGFFQVT